MRHALMMILTAAVIFIPVTPLLAQVRSALDRESMDCLSCHDAIVASDVTFKICPFRDCDHPVGVDYVALAANNPSLRSPQTLNPAIRLAEGRYVGCGSCHVPYTPNHLVLVSMRTPFSPDPMLVVDNRFSGLCLGCHIK